MCLGKTLCENDYETIMIKCVWDKSYMERIMIFLKKKKSYSKSDIHFRIFNLPNC